MQNTSTCFFKGIEQSQTLLAMRYRKQSIQNNQGYQNGMMPFSTCNNGIFMCIVFRLIWYNGLKIFL